jgi:hypothetical protein
MRPHALAMVVAISAMALLPNGKALAQDSTARRPRSSGLREVRADEGSGRPTGWLGFSIGAGSEAYSIKGDGYGYSSYLTRPTLSIDGAARLSRTFDLGGELAGWFSSEAGYDQALSSLMLVGSWYPAGQGLFLKGGLGLGFSTVNGYYPYGYGYYRRTDVGFAGQLGIGAELKVGRRTALVPSLTLYQHDYSSRDLPGYRERIVNFGLGMRFRLPH